MLIVDRRIQQSVVVCEFDGCERVLKVTVLDVRGGKVRLGFEVVADDPLSPAEVWERISAVDRAGKSAHAAARDRRRTRRPTSRRDQAHATIGAPGDQ